MTTAIAAVYDLHYRCHTVDKDNRQKTAFIVYCQEWQWRSLLTEAAVDGGLGNGGLCPQQSSSMEAMVVWRDNEAIASEAMASLANGVSGNGGRLCQLCSSG